MNNNIKIPTWSPSKGWDYTIFLTKDEFKEFIEKLFWNEERGLNRMPGEYGFDKTTLMFNEQARVFNKKGLYCEAPEGSRDFVEYWDTEKEKCRKGVIFHNDKGGTWFLPRFYYHWLNFLQIYNKAEKRFTFPYVRDVQYYMALYEYLAEISWKHSAVMKARQKASSYFHYSKLYNKYIFEDGYVGKVGASTRGYLINPNGSWKFLDHYHNFNNEHTAWACSNNPDKPLSWQQSLETRTADGRKVKIGTKATITGITFEKDATAGVGGAIDEFFYEEGGIAPTADETYIYLKAAMEEGGLTTGHFSIAGSVGKLTACKPLEKFIKKPEENGFYSVLTDLIDEHGTIGTSGLFIAEQFGMPPFIDEYGNSMVKEALEFLEKKNEKAKKDKGQEDYQLEVSQHPRNIAEAFATRTVSIFGAKYTNKQARRIEDGEYPYIHCDLERTEHDDIVIKETDRKPCPYKMDKAAADKRGCVVIIEKPPKEAEWGIYLASVDPVQQGSTKTSSSLACVYIYKRPIEVTRQKGDSVEISVEGDKIVAWWTGRYDDPNETNEQISKLVELYNAKVTCEKNVAGFISYMQLKRRQRYLAHIDDMIFDKEHQVRDNLFQSYGWHNTPMLWQKILSYGVDSVSEELHTLYKQDGTVDRIVYGIERIPDIELIREMQDYNETGNFDRIIAYCALMAFASTQQRIMGAKKKVERKEDTLSKKKLNRILEPTKNIFHNIGNSRYQGSKSGRSVFRNIK